MARKQSAKARASDRTLPAAPNRTAIWRAAGIVAVVLCAFVAHVGSLPGTFVWDDQQMIPDHKWIVPLVTQEQASDSGLARWAARWNLRGLANFWISGEQPDYWPLSYTTHWIEYRIFGPNATGFRLVNLLLHVINSLFVWRLASRLAPSLAGVPAFLCALLFAVHPLSVEAVAWILQRKTLLSTALAFATLDCYLTYDERDQIGWLAVAVPLFALGMLAKTSIVTLPAVLLVISIWRHGRLRIEDVIASLPFFGVALGLGGLALWFQQERSIADDIVRDDGLLSRFALAGWAIWFYLGKALFPVGLCFNYPRWTCDPANLLVFVPSAAWLALGGALLAARRWVTGGPFVAWSWYSLLLFPVLGFVNIYFMKYSLVADHWQYTALPAVVVVVVALGKQVVDRVGAAARVPALVTAGVLATLLLAMSVSHSTVFAGADNQPLWEDTLEKNPLAWSAHNNLASLIALKAVDPKLQLGGNDVASHPATPAERQELWSAARPHYAEAVRLAPHDVSVRTNYGTSLIAAGDNQGAREQFEAALTIKQREVERLRRLGDTATADLILKSSAEIISNLGQLSAAEGNAAAAAEHYRRALELNPEQPKANLNYGQLQLAAGKLEEAERYFLAALRTKPHVAAVHHNLGVVYFRQNRRDKAMLHLKIALKLDPQDRGAATLLNRLQTAGPTG